MESAFLEQIPIFGGLPANVLARIAETFQVVRVTAGTRVIAEGEEARSMFIVGEGEMEVRKRGQAGLELRLAVLRRGDCIGEMSLIDIQPRSATVQAVGQAVLYVLAHAEIAKLQRTDLEVYTLLVLNIAREISRRLRSADRILADLELAAQTMWSSPRGEPPP
jgi:CRP/FNR family cyclic AMP-dependent transcriptional regulator